MTHRMQLLIVAGTVLAACVAGPYVLAQPQYEVQVPDVADLAAPAAPDGGEEVYFQPPQGDDPDRFADDPDRPRPDRGIEDPDRRLPRPGLRDPDRPLRRPGRDGPEPRGEGPLGPRPPRGGREGERLRPGPEPGMHPRGPRFPMRPAMGDSDVQHMRARIELIEQMQRTSFDPAAAGIMALGSIQKDVRREKPEQLVADLEDLLTKTKSLGLRNAIRMTLKDLYRHLEQDEKVLELMKAMVLENDAALQAREAERPAKMPPVRAKQPRDRTPKR